MDSKLNWLNLGLIAVLAIAALTVQADQGLTSTAQLSVFQP